MDDFLDTAAHEEQQQRKEVKKGVFLTPGVKPVSHKSSLHDGFPQIHVTKLNKHSVKSSVCFIFGFHFLYRLRTIRCSWAVLSPDQKATPVLNEVCVGLT